MATGNDRTTTRDRCSDECEESLYGSQLGPHALVGNYEILEVRSRGGFATVYRARHLRLGRQVAIKILHQFLCGSPRMLRRFEQEARAANLIRHPNIVDVSEIGELTDGRPYIVMEWLDGRDLEEELRVRGAFAPTDALALLEDLGAALGAAHAAGIVHRDLKASNVVLVPAGGWHHVKLVDFGIAKLLDRDARGVAGVTSEGLRLGTPWNMAPEQVRGEAVDARTDIYALGVLLYQMLTRELPFFAETPAEVEALHLSAPPPRASDRVPVSSAIDAVVQRCLQKDRNARYADVPELLRDLRRAILGAPPPLEKATTRAPAIGVHVAITVDTTLDETSDVVLDQILAALDDAQKVLLAAGLVPVVSTGNMIAAARLLPADDERGRAARLEVTAAALALARRAREGIALGITLHVDSVLVPSGEETRFVGGELLRLDWATAGRGAVVASAALLSGIEDRFALAPDGRGGLRVLAARS
jgi:serine/threonine-protein kinase